MWHVITVIILSCLVIWLFNKPKKSLYERLTDEGDLKLRDHLFDENGKKKYYDPEDDN